MKKVILLAICLMTYAVGLAGPPEPKVGFRWVLNKEYSDEFNGNNLDRTKWNNTFRGWQGRQPARFAPSAVSVKNGTMQIKNTLSKNPRNGYTIDGGAVQSKGTGAYFGYYECRFKASRVSMSTTFWLSNGKRPVNFVTKKSNGQNCPRDRFSQELDIIESIGGVFNGSKKFRENMNFNTHYRYIDCNGGKEKFYSKGNNAVEGNGQQSNSKLSSESWQEFHTYGAYWKNANEVDFYADNRGIGSVRVSTDVVNQPFPDRMQINMVTETYNWAKPYPSPQQLANNNINTSYYDWIRSYELVPIDKAPRATNFTAGKVFKENISFFASPKLVNGNKQVEVSYLYAANANRQFRLRVLNASNQEVATVNFDVLEGLGKNKKTVNLSTTLPQGNYTFIGETREKGSNKLMASTGKDVVVAPTPKPTTPKPTPKPTTPIPTPNVSNPVVNFTKPTTQLNLKEGANMLVDVAATDADGIANVRLYLNNTFIRQENVKPYLWGANDNALKNLKAGTYQLKAVATDRKGDKGERSITFVVGAKIAPTPTPNQASQILADGVYSIKSSFSDQRVLSRNVEKFSARMHNVGPWADQHWIIKRVRNNVYTIQNKGNKRYLTAQNNCNNGTDATAQFASNFNQWEIVKTGNTYSFISANCGGFALDISGGAVNGNLHMWKFNNKNRNQLFNLLPVSGAKDLSLDSLGVTFGPNPAQAYVDIAGIPENGVITITSLLGQNLVTLKAASDTERISLSAFASGMYFIRVNNSVPKKLIVSK